MPKEIDAALVRLSIGVFSNSRNDPGITQDVRVLHKLSGKAGKWIKYKLPEEALMPIKKFAGECRRRHYDLTLPWEDAYRLLTVASQASYNDQFTGFQKEFNKLVEAFIEEYPNWLAQARIMHSKTFNAADYPTVQGMRESFKFEMEYTPVPNANHFVKSFAEEQVTAMSQDLEARNEQRIAEAVADTWNRMIAPVRAMADKLSSKEGIFRDTLVQNIKDIVELVPALNLTNNPQIVEAAKVIMDQLGSLDVDTLRDNKIVRQEAAEAAKNLVARFGAVGKRKFAA
ncbi:MAG: uncharacterized protein JWM68_248 [Verrucomicrobiales bacterium]|nr:uncharacterized protein [Verrucomicrobiales bacterium]